ACVGHRAPRSDARPTRSTGSRQDANENKFATLTRGLFHFSTDTNLAVEFDPVKPKRGVRIGVELFALRAFIICKEDEAILIEAFQQNDSHGRSRVARRRRKTHRIDVVNASLDRGGEPVGKLLDGVAVEVATSQPSADVLV